MRHNQLKSSEAITVEGIRYEYDSARGKWLGDYTIQFVQGIYGLSITLDQYFGGPGPVPGGYWAAIVLECDCTLVAMTCRSQVGSGRADTYVKLRDDHATKPTDHHSLQLTQDREYDFSIDVDLNAGDAIVHYLDVGDSDSIHIPVARSVLRPRLVV